MESGNRETGQDLLVRILNRKEKKRQTRRKEYSLHNVSDISIQNK